MKMVILFIVLINLVNGQSPDDICYECNTGYSYNTQAKKCVKCQVGTNNAKVCTGCETNGEGKCDSGKCVDGYYYDTDKCVACTDTHCKKCDADHAKCDATENCDEGYGKSEDGTCVKCDTGCNDHQCKVANQCEQGQCGNGYYWASNKCNACPTGCTACSDADTCTACDTGYTKTSANKCIECAQGCKKDQCAVDGQCNENQCEDGYYYANNICNSCSTAMSGCATCTSGTVCTTCSSGLDPNKDNDEATKDTCPSCNDANCKTCSSTEVDKCSVCAEGWTLIKAANSEEGHCVKCDTNCQKDQCTETGKCKTCATGFYKVVTPAPDPDVQLTADDNTEGTCSPCLANCDVCSDSTTCTTCSAKHYKVAGQNGAADTCNSCTESLDTSSKLYLCDECSDATHCTKCQTSDSYIINKIGDECVPCSDHCSQCTTTVTSKDTAGKCDQGKCTLGYYLDEDLKTCRPCSGVSTGCEECSNEDTCTKCNTENGYYLDETTHKCKVCNNKNNDGKCKKCVKDPEPPAPQDDSSVMVSIVLGLIALIALF